MGSHSSDLMKRIRYKLPVCLDFQSFGWDRGDLIQLNEGIPYIFICQLWEIDLILIHIASSSSAGTCYPQGGALALGISSSSLPAAFLRVFILPISTTIVLDAKSHNRDTLIIRYKITKKERDS